MPLGIETLYEALKSLVQRRINRIIRDWRNDQTILLSREPLEELRRRALISVGNDSLLSDEERRRSETWIKQTAADAKTAEEDRKMALATFLITERRITRS
jgi:hypothetical protein